VAQRGGRPWLTSPQVSKDALSASPGYIRIQTASEELGAEHSGNHLSSCVHKDSKSQRSQVSLQGVRVSCQGDDNGGPMSWLIFLQESGVTFSLSLFFSLLSFFPCNIQ
jgi:hypothetical protein